MHNFLFFSAIRLHKIEVSSHDIARFCKRHKTQSSTKQKAALPSFIKIEIMQNSNGQHTSGNLWSTSSGPQEPAVQSCSIAAEMKKQPTVAASTGLASKLVGDVVIGCGVTFCVAPFLTVVDKAIVESAAGSRTLVQSGLESVQGIFRNPSNYLKSPTFLLMWGVYAATYSTANSLKTISEHQEYSSRTGAYSQQDPSPSSNSKMGVFLGTTLVNSSSALLKDQAYAKMFGTASTTTVVPRMTYAFWIARDFSVIGSSFILPDLVSGHVANALDMDEKTAKSMSQLFLPVAAQFVAGPLHYLGLDLYNRDLRTKSWPEAVVDRSKSLCRGFAPVVMARIARIAPGYGIGGVFNTNLRDGWREYLVQREEHGPSVGFFPESSSMPSIFKTRQVSYRF